ncbi:hypothetical protein ACFVYC_10725 [Pseudarthrobacter sp. NPDC058329]|uniref:hypothetical protein n=1 Tax=Pseudarthrobacter sp. NPDC058329 TaxID=3346448 RepID=UPI0036DF1335
MNRTPLRRLLTGAAAAGLGISLLASCSAPDLDGSVATQLQTRVAEAKQLAAQQDPAAALAKLDQLSQDVATAAGQGRMSQQRQTRIEAAIGTIRSELETTAVPAPAAPAPAPADPQVSEEQQEQAEEAREEAEKQREDAQKEAEKKRDKSG